MTKEITAAELAKHKATDDLWLAIRGEVYDVTPFVDEHPGGSEVLLDEAGKDATAEFDQIGHSDEAEAMLAQFHVGKLIGGDVSSGKKKAGGSAGASSVAAAGGGGGGGGDNGGAMVNIVLPIVVVVAVIAGLRYLQVL
eukprot:CAMPEP_0198317402 /NCGR_PEP_ID=MMETSP1450-20131203/6890_1 /TAXON_ID=753684 ORGANISM="Madagascaria erythrocladiodes, Strain CCMP3234" /NCGR_SAMPLE_ID=MMETSP1450 /ASSEMBLY_ACC=CAM_ASM_001115 /LENGTH=138 /DNA_ID=CAMNT_0044020601 /DNA_START=82 /DNA_END=498 /DNA_ORIENTATION=+